MNRSPLAVFKFSAFGIAAFAAVTTVAAPRFCLPEKLYAAPDREINVYYRQIFDSCVPQNYAFQCVCDRGKTEQKRWCWTPTAEDAGKSFKLVINAWNDDGKIASVTSVIEVAATPKNAARKLTLALFADSLTNSKYQDRILVNMREAGFPNYTPIGAHKGVKLRPNDLVADHDGYGGYTCKTFLTQYTVSDEEFAHVQDQAEREQLLSLGVPTKIVHAWQRELLRSPLVRFRNGKKVVDVQAWLDDNNGGQPPDVIVIELGVNDIFHYEGEVPELRHRVRSQVLPNFTKLIATLRTRAPDAWFAICTQPIGTSQDGFGANYGSKWNLVQHRKNCFALNRELYDYVKGLKDPMVEILPMGHAIDTEDGYVYRQEKVNAVSDQMIRRNSNAVHPNLTGGKQIGDAIAAWLRTRWNAFAK